MSKKKVLIVIGAGASLDFGMPSVAKVGELLSQAAQRRFPLAAEPSTNLYDRVAADIEAYWRSFSKPALARTPHFENVLYALLALASTYPHGDFTSTLGALVESKPLPDVNWFGRDLRQVDGTVLSNLTTDCADVIIGEFRDRCRGLGTSHATQLAELRSFLSALTGRFDVAVINLNYDNVVYRCMPSAPVTGFTSDGSFDERQVLERQGWPCFLHLHGSVHFDMRTRGHEIHAVHWQDDLGATFSQNAAGRSSVYSDEGVVFPQSVIVAGHGKTAQILRRPFRTYYSEVDRLVLVGRAPLPRLRLRRRASQHGAGRLPGR